MRAAASCLLRCGNTVPVSFVDLSEVVASTRSSSDRAAALSSARESSSSRNSTSLLRKLKWLADEPRAGRFCKRWVGASHRDDCSLELLLFLRGTLHVPSRWCFSSRSAGARFQRGAAGEGFALRCEVSVKVREVRGGARRKRMRTLLTTG